MATKKKKALAKKKKALAKKKKAPAKKKKAAPKKKKAAATRDPVMKLRAIALAYPDTREEFPWGDRVVKVGKKVFIFMGTDKDGSFGFSVKLPQSGGVASMLPFMKPTGYGLGKSGWLTATFEKGDEVPFDLAQKWIDESYRAVAPKSLVKKLDL